MLEFNATDTKDMEYTETPQINEMRWRTLYQEEDGTFTPTSNQFKCKDYLNDVVLGKKGHVFRMYGFNNVKKYNKEGLFLHLLHLKSGFVHNLGLVNSWCEETNEDKEKFCVSIVKKDPKSAIIFIPEWVLQSTYMISLVSWLIRISSHEEKAENCVKLMNSARQYGDCPFSNYVTQAIKNGMNLPTKKKYFFFNYAVNSEMKEKVNYTYLHDNGVREWLGAVEMRKSEARA